MLKHKRLTSILAATLVAAAMIFSSCVREDVTNADLPKGAIRLLADGFKDPKGSKLGVDDQGANVYFINGDKIWINGIEHTVSNSSGTTAYFTPDPSLCNENGEINVDLCAVYPADIVTNYSGGSSVDINLPATQEYVLADNGRQNVKAPLCAYISARDANSSRSIQFKHITAAITVAIDNKLSVRLKVKELTLTNSGFELRKSLTINTNNLSVPYASQNSQNNEISIDFTNQECSVPANGKIYIQIPILPIQVTNPEDGTKGLFTISLKAENDLYGIPEFEYDYLNEQKTTIDPSTGQYRSLVLNVRDLAYAPVEFSPTSAALRVDGLFSISSTEKVFFSKGNLRYKIPTTTTENADYYASSNAWDFCENQYDIIEKFTTKQSVANALNPGNGSYTGLFKYAYNGEGECPRKLKQGNAPVIYHGDLRGCNYEWGRRIGDGKWFTLSETEWAYLLGREMPTTLANTAPNAVKGKSNMTAKVNGIEGIILFPDNYWTILGPTAPTGAGLITINQTTWKNMEKYGAVFLPATGHAYPTGRGTIDGIERMATTACKYWTSSIDGDNVRYLLATISASTSLTSNAISNMAKASTNLIAVRLVRLAQQPSQSK